LRELLERLVAAGLVSAAAARIEAGGRPLAVAVAGRRRIGRVGAPRRRDLFDVASLAKPFVATLALRLDARGVLPLASRVGDHLPGARPLLARRTLGDLLRHRAGLAPWFPLETLGRAAARPGALARWLAREAPLGAPPGTYSDLSYLLWGELARQATGERLEELLAREVLRPLRLLGEAAVDPPRARCVDCRLDRGREAELARALGIPLDPGGTRLLRGRPQDGNARFLRRFAGHAGLFATTAALAALGRAWLRPPPGFLARRAVDEALDGGGPYVLGWARRSRDGSSGFALSRDAFGHTGFTGASLWIDPQRDAVFVLAAHRLDSRADFNPSRRELHVLGARLAEDGG
jgi:CubicO group peptidase (beta-lactamase class C family)